MSTVSNHTELEERWKDFCETSFLHLFEVQHVDDDVDHLDGEKG